MAESTQGSDLSFLDELSGVDTQGSEYDFDDFTVNSQSQTQVGHRQIVLFLLRPSHADPPIARSP